VVEAIVFRFVGRRTLHLLPDPHIDRKRNRHDHHNTDSQYEKPPEHPHNVFKDSRCALATTCAASPTDGQRTTIGLGQALAVGLCALACAFRWFSIFFETFSSRLRAVFDPVATCSI
jgi:hypothetical protein